MESTFDAFEFVGYLRARWLVPVVSCAVAVALAIGFSQLIPRRYTATATILILPPGGNDPRAATAVSPVYLESLKTYERFASGDNLFERALKTVHAREAGSGASIEGLKASILKVSKPASTPLLDISATMLDPKQAHALVEYIAGETVALNRTLDAESSTDAIGEFRGQLKIAQERRGALQEAMAALSGSLPVEKLENEVQEAADLKYRVERDLANARTDLASYRAQRSAGGDDDAWLAKQIGSAQARVTALEAQARELSDSLAKKTPQLAEWKARRDSLDGELQGAQRAYDRASDRLNDVLSTAQFRGERLQLIDSGMIPQRPSSPNTMLNLIAALLFALTGSLVFLAVRFSYTRVADTRAARAYSVHQAR